MGLDGMDVGWMGWDFPWGGGKFPGRLTGAFVFTPNLYKMHKLQNIRVNPSNLYPKC